MKRHLFSIRSLVIYIIVVTVLIFSGTTLAQFLPSQTQSNPIISLVFSSLVIPFALFLFQKDVERFMTEELERYKTTLGFREADTKRSIEVRDTGWEKFQAICRDLESFLQPMKYGNSYEQLAEADKKLFSRIREAVDELTLYFPINSVYLPDDIKSEFQKGLESIIKVSNAIFFHYLGLEPLAPAYDEFEHTRAHKAELENLIRKNIHLLEL